MNPHPKPDVDNLQELLEYLDDLRDSGETNMFGSGAYLQRDFGLTRDGARKVVLYWMSMYSERHP